MAAGAASLTGRDSFWWMRTGYFPATSYVVVSPLSTRTQSTSRKGLQTNLHNSQHRRPLNCTEVIKFASIKSLKFIALKGKIWIFITENATRQQWEWAQWLLEKIQVNQNSKWGLEENWQIVSCQICLLNWYYTIKWITMTQMSFRFI